MATSPFVVPTDQNSIENQNELLRNTNLVNPSGEIQTEPPQPPQKSRGRKPGPETGKPKEKRRGMGVAKLERLRIEEEKKKMFLAHGGMITWAASPNATPSPDPGFVLQGFASYGTGGPNMSIGRSGILCGGVGSGQIPVYSPWGFVETSPHELSLFPNPQMYNPSNNHSDTCFKKRRIDEDQNVVPSNDPHILPPDQRSQGFFYDHRIAGYSTPTSASTNQGSVEDLGGGNPRNGTRDVKEYEFFPGNYGNESVSSVSTSVGDCSPDRSTIDLSLKL